MKPDMMLKFLTAAAAILLGVVSPVLALAETPSEIPSTQNTGADKQLIEQFANFYSPVAKAFNCPRFAWGSFLNNHKSILLEYVPEGDNVNSWTRLMSISLYPLPKETTTQNEIMGDMRTHLLSRYSKGKIYDQELYQYQSSSPGLFIEYEIGDGIQREHNAGAFMKTLPTTASFIQIQSRGKPFDKADASNMKLFAQHRLPLALAHER